MKDACGIHAGYMRALCGIHAGYMYLQRFEDTCMQDTRRWYPVREVDESAKQNCDDVRK